MIVSRTPYRISLFGGGSDYYDWLKYSPGATLSFSTAYYSHIFLRPLSSVFGSKYRIRYFKREEVNSVDEIDHPIIRHALMHRIKQGSLSPSSSLDIIHSGDFPSMTGLGTSSCFTVGLLKALDQFSGRQSSKYGLSREAIYIEQVLNGETVGSQDQIAAAFGGINYVDYHSPSEFTVSPMSIDQSWLEVLLSRLYLVYTGVTRHSAESARDFVGQLGDRSAQVKALVSLAAKARDVMRGAGPPDDIGQMLHESWQLKRSAYPSSSTDAIDALYDSLRGSGAIGGKLLGAGGGGFILCYVPELEKERFMHDTSEKVVLPVSIDWDGCSVKEF